MLERGAHNDNLCVGLFYLYTRCQNYVYELDNDMKPAKRKFQMLAAMFARGNEDKIRTFRNKEGGSLLHFVCKHAIDGLWNTMLLFCVKQLLSLGLNPRERDSNNNTVLDCLLSTPYYSTGMFRHTQLKYRVDHSHYEIHSFIECVHTLLPYFKDTYMAELNIPKLRSMKYTSVEDLTLDTIKSFQGFVYKDMFPDTAETHFATFILDTDVLFCERSYPCVFCLPLVDRLYQELCKGFDLNKYVRADMCRCGKPKTIPQRIVLTLTFSPQSQSLHMSHQQYRRSSKTTRTM